MDVSLGTSPPVEELVPSCAPVQVAVEGAPEAREWTGNAQSASEEFPVESSRQGRSNWLARLVPAGSGNHSLALMDQAVVSVTNFLTTLLIGRWCGADELGVYAIGFSLLVSWSCVQDALISLPYAIQWHRRSRETSAEYAGGALVQSGLLSVLAIILLALSAVLLLTGGAKQGLVTMAWMLAGMMPFALLREFGRRFAFAHLRMTQALILDLAVAGMQLAALIGLALSGLLSATMAYAALGAACALAGAVWLYRGRESFVIRREEVWPTVRRNWGLGKWLFASQVVLIVQGYIIYWVLPWFGGTAAAGKFAACMSIVQFSNPLLLGYGNALMPRTAQAFTHGGAAALSRVVFRAALLLGAAMTLFCGAVWFAGEDVLRWLYHSPEYEGHGSTVLVLALSALVMAVGMPASNGLAAIERPDVIFRAGLLAVAVAVVLVPCLVQWWGVPGAAYACLASSVAASAGRWVAFSIYVARPAKEVR